MNVVSIAGRAARDPESNGTVTKFTVAVDDWNSATSTKEAQFIPCVAFGKTAEVVSNFVTKGREVAVTGKMRENKWTDKDGNKRSRWEVIVDRIDLMGGGGRSGGGGGSSRPSHRDEGDEGGFELYGE